ncbi:Syntaxin-32 [Camellia lanceoleosa]|uniref:Syntaxin-32 n=1 Tax=Camellia lanceoleosa TaxID=1840588 RepID=A0ACC0FLL3_9ERIC|nr:Syntaxin-32 [Camellia lanceoleosa]
MVLRKQADRESQPLLQQQQHQQQQQMVPLQDSYMQSRAEALHNVESTIHELGNIFTQLATMVSQQGELAIRLVHGLLLHICQTCMCCQQHNNDDTFS